MLRNTGLGIMCLLFALHPGAGLQCYESACLSEPTTCGWDDSVVLRRCSAGVMRDLLSEAGVVPFPSLLLRLMPMTCLKQVVGDSSFKMCFPRVPKLCSAVGFVTRRITRSEYEEEEAFLQCHSCSTDGCNVASTRTAGLLVLCSGLLLLLRLAVA